MTRTSPEIGSADFPTRTEVTLAAPLAAATDSTQDRDLPHVVSPTLTDFLTTDGKRTRPQPCALGRCAADGTDPVSPHPLENAAHLRGRARQRGRLDRRRRVHRLCESHPPTHPLRIAVMGCVVNGAGETREADLGVSCGNGKGQIYRQGHVLRTVPEPKIIEALLNEALHLTDGTPDEPTGQTS